MSVPLDLSTGDPLHHSAEEGSALALVSALVRHRRLLWRYPLIIAVVVTSLSFLFPNVYRSTVTILPPESDFQSMGQPVGGLKSLFVGEMSLPMMATPSDILGEVLKSRTVRDTVMVRLRLPERWDLTPSNAHKHLRASVAVEVAETGMLKLRVTDTDRWFCDTLGNVLVESADRLNQAIVNTKARRTREFVERRLEETRASLSRAVATLEEFQDKHRTVALDAEIAALVENAAELRAQLTSDEIELSVLEGTLSAEHHRIRSLRTRIRETAQKLRDLEMPADGDTVRSFLGMGLRELPKLAQDLAQLLRDVAVAEALYELLTQQYEHARIQERRDTPSFSVLDWAVGGGTKVRPKRLMLALATLVSTFGLLVGYVLFREYLVRLEHTDPHRHRSVMNMWKSLRPARKKETSSGVTR